MGEDAFARAEDTASSVYVEFRNGAEGFRVLPKEGAPAAALVDPFPDDHPLASEVVWSGTHWIVAWRAGQGVEQRIWLAVVDHGARQLERPAVAISEAELYWPDGAWRPQLAAHDGRVLVVWLTAAGGITGRVLGADGMPLDPAPWSLHLPPGPRAQGRLTLDPLGAAGWALSWAPAEGPRRMLTGRIDCR